eukprot:s1803_g11.t1
MYVERSRSRDDSSPSPPGRAHHRWPAHHQTQLPFPPSSSTSSEAPAWRDVVIVADFSEVSYLADENWNFSAMHPLNHVPLSMMEEKALWQYTRYVYSNQVDTYTFDHLLSGIAERIEEQWQIEISPDALELRYDENQGLEVFQVTSDQPYWNLRNLLDHRLITEIRNMPGAASLEESQAQLLDMVRRSDVVTSFNFLQLTNLAIQIQQLADVVASLETPPMDTFSSMAANPTDDVHLTDSDHIDL